MSRCLKQRCISTNHYHHLTTKKLTNQRKNRKKCSLTCIANTVTDESSKDPKVSSTISPHQANFSCTRRCARWAHTESSIHSFFLENKNEFPISKLFLFVFVFFSSHFTRSCKLIRAADPCPSVGRNVVSPQIIQVYQQSVLELTFFSIEIKNKINKFIKIDSPPLYVSFATP